MSLKDCEPPSVTRIVIGYTPGPWASVGHQLNCPPGVIVEPLGAPGSSVKDSAPPFAAVAVAVNVRQLPSFTVLFPMAARTGGPISVGPSPSTSCQSVPPPGPASLYVLSKSLPMQP